MIANLLRYPDEATAIKALPQFYHQPDGDFPGGWDMSRCIPNTRVDRVTGTEQVAATKDEPAYEREITEDMPGFFIQVYGELEDATLKRMTNCTVLDMKVGGREVQAFKRSADTTLDAFTGWRISPVMAGSVY